MVDVAVFTVLRTKVIREGGVKMEVVLLFVTGPLATCRLPGRHNLGPYVLFFSFLLFPNPVLSQISVK